MLPLLLTVPLAVLRSEAALAAVRPNVIVIQTDDQAMRSLRATYRLLDGRRVRVMPNLLDRIGAKGIEFTRHYATNPVCAPSRAALLSGRYSHTSGFLRNGGDHGGWTGWQRLPLLNDNLATRLQGNGYRTVHLGKFTNDYLAADGSPETLVPPGWDRWMSTTYGKELFYYGYRFNQNGLPTDPFGSDGYDLAGGDRDPSSCTRTIAVDPVAGAGCMHSSDRISQAAVSEIESASGPFYMQVDYHTPHGDDRSPAGPEPPARYYDTAFKNKVPRGPGFDEADIRDKPRWLRQRASKRMSNGEIETINTWWRKELESLRGVDDGIGAILDALTRAGQLGNTYIFFMSDNGFFHGEHRLSRAKFLAYEPSARVPLLVRGPGVPAGRRSRELTANIDVAPTVMSLTGTPGANEMDGRSMRNYWRNPNRRSWRPLLLESFLVKGDYEGEDQGASVSVAAPAINFKAIRAGDFKYVEYTGDGSRELYDLRRDPHELQNLISRPSYRPVAQRLRSEMLRRAYCAAAACRRPIAPLRGWKR